MFETTKQRPRSMSATKALCLAAVQIGAATVYEI